MTRTLMTAAAAARVEKAGGDIAHIARLLADHMDRKSQIPTLRESFASAMRTIRGNKAIRSVCVVVMKADDSVEMIRIGQHGGIKRITRLLDPNGRPV